MKMLSMLGVLGLVAGSASLQAAAPKMDEMLPKVEAALPAKALVAPAKPRKLLIYTRTLGYRHSSIPIGSKAVELMGKKTQTYEATTTEDNSFFEPERLKEFDAVLMLSTTGELFEARKDKKKPPTTAPADPNARIAATLATPAAEDPATVQRLRKSLLEFVASGKGLAGIHAATDCSYKWDAYGQMIGGYFAGHPWNEKVGILVEEPEHPLCRPLGVDKFTIADEIYQFKDPYSRDKQRVLMSLDPAATAPKGKRADSDYPVVWVKPYEKGRVFYCSLGHREEVYWNPQVLKIYLAGLQFAMGDLTADATPTGKRPAMPPAARPATEPAMK